MSYRIPTTQLELPYDINDLRVPVNGVHTNDIFNNRIELLASNFDYLLESASLVNNNSPQSYDYAYDFEGSIWTSTPSSLLTSPPSNHGYTFIEVVEIYNGKFLYICTTSTEIDFFIGGDISNGDSSSLIHKITYDQVKQNGTQKYKNITYVKYNTERLYVYDSAYSALIVYDIGALLYGDVVVENIKFVKQLTQVKNLKALDFSTNIYAVTNTEIIIFNRDLNILSRADLQRSAPSVSPNGIIVGDDVYIIYSRLIDYYNLSLEFLRTEEIEGFNNESFIDIESSKIDDNIVYLLSKDYLYKYDIVDNTIIGYFELGYTNNRNFEDVYVKDGDTQDEIFLTDKNKLHFMEDSISYAYVYDRTNLLDRQSISDIQINDLELEQDFVFNSVIQRILFNNLLLYNSLIYKAVAVTDDNGFLKYSYRKNLVNSEIIDPAVIYIGQNEVFSYQVFQRAFNEILNIQKSILNLIQYEFTENSSNTLSV